MNLLAHALLAFAAGIGPSDSTGAVASRYLDLTFSQQYEALRDVYADNVRFVDPTGDVWSEELAEGVSGADQVIALQKSWGITSSDFRIDEAFVVGEYALFRGRLSWTSRDNPDGVTIDFLTVIRVIDGKVTERHDYGDYVAGFAGSMPDSVHVNTRGTEELGTRYFRAYLDQRHDFMEQSYATDVSFQDPTAAYFGPSSGGYFQGRDNVTTMMRRVFQPITEFTFDVEHAWFSNHHAVFMGTCRFSLEGAAVGAPTDVTFEHPAVFVVTVVDGKVVAHRDFVDYSTFRDQLEAAKQ